ncbi:MAG: hypothetical protein K2X77_09385 [Candidatus Obscuribacterales bacterium]|jgi:hypothetical protein|nr:hypothetical protein [Candidatus Obscuribacterales bacterium]
MRSKARFAQALSYALTVGAVLTANTAGFAAISDSHMPRMAPQSNDAPVMRPMDPKNVPDFVNYNAEAQNNPAAATTPGGARISTGTALRAGLQSATLPVETRMRLVVEYPVSATSSVPGDIFEGHVRDDLSFGRTLILPRGSLVRGRITDVAKPRLLSRAGKIGLKLDQIVTPTGEVIPLDATLEFKKGTTNKAGQLDPGTNFGTRVESSVRTVAGMNEKGAARGAIVAANIATLGAPIVATAIGSSAIALFRSGDDISLTPGQELEILLTNALGVQVE